MAPKRMTGKQLRALRVARGETLEAFGAYLAKITGASRAYSRQEVNAWEAGRSYADGKVRKVPLAVELALLRRGEI